ncbi:MAG: hypothetical protein JSR80_06675 [Verrucomicrobia bacterium]|nr:hypothetical protein [Verrucomicrobiota bacterium]
MELLSKKRNVEGSLFPRITEALPPARSLPRGPQAFKVEARYALREIDPRSVRPLKAPKPQDPQLYMPFASTGHGTMPSLRLDEPIQVLDLSRHSERFLLNRGQRTVGEIYTVLLDHPGGVEGINRWMAKEVQEAVAAYLEGLDDPFATAEVDFLSLLRASLGDLDRVSVHLFLKPFELEELFPLKQTDKERLRRLGPHERQWRSEQVARELLRIERQKRVWSSLHRMVEEFIEPWICKRGGIAKGRALMERACSIAVDRQAARQVIHVLEKLYGSGKELWALLLTEVDDCVYCKLPEVALQYELVLICARRYFYHPTIVYPLQHLVELVSSEIVRKWEGFKAGFVERAIKGSSTFKTCKGKVRLSGT